jgi:zinc transport system substrate-binding protein|nr:zinc ABC transporter substrate-binding protein [uncultured Lachnoclostridium sp.]
MKRKLKFLLSVMLILSLISYGAIKIQGKNKQYQEEGLTIVTSFYPMYIAALNIADGIDGVQVVNLTENQTGCVHDYQLTTKDMRTLSGAQVVILNGGDMEEFMEDVLNQQEEIQVIDSSAGMDFLTGSTHNHSGESYQEDNELYNQYSEEIDHDHTDEESSNHPEDDHDHTDEESSNHPEHDHDHTDEESSNHPEDDHIHTNDDSSNQSESSHVHTHSNLNGHVWLNVHRYMQQIQTITEGLCEFDPTHEAMYRKNEDKYLEQLQSIKEEIESLKEIANGAEIIIFHDSFAYLAEELGMEVVHAVNTDGETALSAGEIAEVIEEINLHDIKYLFTEEQYEHTIADRIEAETNATVYVMDSLVTGGVNKDSYLKGMKKNIEMLKEALLKDQK